MDVLVDGKHMIFRGQSGLGARVEGEHLLLGDERRIKMRGGGSHLLLRDDLARARGGRRSSTPQDPDVWGFAVHPWQTYEWTRGEALTQEKLAWVQWAFDQYSHTTMTYRLMYRPGTGGVTDVYNMAPWHGAQYLGRIDDQWTILAERTATRPAGLSALWSECSAMWTVEEIAAMPLGSNGQVGIWLTDTTFWEAYGWPADWPVYKTGLHVYGSQNQERSQPIGDIAVRLYTPNNLWNWPPTR